MLNHLPGCSPFVISSMSGHSSAAAVPPPKPDEANGGGGGREPRRSAPHAGVCPALAAHRRFHQAQRAIHGVAMPVTEAGEVHHRRLALPDGVGPETPLWTIRHTGEAFTSYE